MRPRVARGAVRCVVASELRLGVGAAARRRRAYPRRVIREPHALLSRRRFPGPARSADPRRTRFVGQAEFDGAIAAFSLPRPVAAALLPPGVELAWSPDGGAHPVIYLFGDQRAGTVLVGGQELPLDIDYPEVGLCVPFVTVGSDKYLHTCVAFMATPHAGAAWSGDRLYGYAKVEREIHRDGDTLCVADASGRVESVATARATGAPMLPAAGRMPEGLAAICEMFALPIVGRNRSGLIASYFAWNLAGAAFRSTEVTLTTEVPSLASMPIGTLRALPGAAFEVRGMRWRVSWPESLAPDRGSAGHI